MTPQTHRLEPLAAQATSLLKALSHPARLMICCQLRHTEMSVGDIEQALGIRQPRLSRELAKLREEGLVETRRDAKLVFYTLSDRHRVREMVDAICAVMLDKNKPGSAQKDARPRPVSEGGFGVFARTSS